MRFKDYRRQPSTEVAFDQPAVMATMGGLYVSFSRDLPTNQTIAATACVVLAAAVVLNVACRVMSFMLHVVEKR